ncbi:chitin synthase chs-2-like [Saccostrea echinata]|uniref:chitin synthase chs-2-like n=1 Tax=Saccostrea echinata TaxID=191078 RepID=UPI002A819243|nr:chitin synthase chs-2-like [Saccostrea echinata]
MCKQLNPSRKFFNPGGLTFPDEEEDGAPIPMNTMQNTDGGLSNPAYTEDEESTASSSHEHSIEEDEVFDDDPPSYKSRESHDDVDREVKDTGPKHYKWDVFRLASDDNISGSELACWNACFVINRVVLCALIFFFVCVTSVISKFTFILMTTNIFPPNGELKNPDKTLKYFKNRQLTSVEVTWIWSLLIAIIAPYVFIVFKYILILLFKKTRKLNYKVLLAALCIETLHSIGLCTFVLVVLPSFEPISATLLCSSVSLVPALLKTIYPERTLKKIEEKDESRLRIARAINTLAIIFQMASIGLWTYYVYHAYKSTDSHTITMMVLVALSPILVSVTWWENYVKQAKSKSKNSSDPDENSSGLMRLKLNMRRHRVKVGFLVNLWKIIMTLLVMPSLLFGGFCSDRDTCIDVLFLRTAGGANLTTIVNATMTDTRSFGEGCISYFPFMISMANVLSNIICFKVAKAASKIVAQKLCFALPVVLSTPIVIGFILGFYSQTISITFGTCILPMPVWSDTNKDPTILFDIIETYWVVIAAGALGYMSFLLVTNHMWSPSKERLIATDRLFVQPLFNGVLLDQSLLLNRRRTDEEFKRAEEHNESEKKVPIPENEDIDEKQEIDWSILRKDDTPMIYFCATMWHESETEMIQILKSIFRQDEDQCARRHLQMFLGIKDPDYYEFEAHVFFDDAFQAHGDEDFIYQVNDFVHLLVNCIDIAASAVHKTVMIIPPPVKYPTPYGGRLEWQLPGGNKIIAHLKDKAKIRHRKRWSQVMYMYYFLAHKLMNIPKKSKAQRRVIAENTFLLALDGDVDFQPKAVQLLVDRMKKNPKVGAACGRIHPIGSGPMVWYQQFEYAISHWLQKAAENIMGCVLCSPGCFSLFRGSSVMDDNVMRRYTTPPTEPQHYVQYDQGEDRWLCTLLLQQGYKVEYVAASDALTYAPEGFNEFYNQRRRWSPSTMANIIDLLMDWKNVTRKNEDISKLYILYQTFLMVCSILTPGTIFLMILGAITMAFPSIPPFAAMTVNIIPVIGMVILCFVAKSNVQLTYAAIVSTIYSLLMMVVLVGLLVEAAGAGLCSVTTLFLLFVAGVFVVSALLHPQEFFCVLHGFLYFLSIPSMSMLLMIYSLGNLHVVSWGTRETKVAAPPPQQGNQPTQQNKVQSWLNKLGVGDNAGTSDYTFSCGNLLRCVCCPHTSASHTEDMRFRAILERLDDIESRMTEVTHSRIDSSSAINVKLEEETLPFSKQNGIFEGAVERTNPAFVEEKDKKRDELKDPYWIHDASLKEGATCFLSQEEIQFWKEFIPQYLKPLEGNKEHEKQVQRDLIELRNKVCLAFLLMNALFVTIVYVLTEVNASTSQTLSIKLPCEVNNGRQGQGYIEPISFAFTAIFGIMLLLQFVCMLFHRFSTFIHIAASTEIRLKRKLIDTMRRSDKGPKEIGVEEGLQLVKEMQAQDNSDTMSLMSQETTVSDDLETTGPSRGRELWKKIGQRQRKATNGKTLSRNFAKNFAKLNLAMQEQDKSSTRGISEQDDLTEDKVAAVQKVFKNRFQRKSLLTIVTLAQSKQKQEIQKRASLLKKKKVQSAWVAAANRVRLQERIKARENGEGDSSKVGFAEVMKTAAALERKKKLSMQQRKEEKYMAEIDEEEEPKPKKHINERKARISVDNVSEWPAEHAYAVQPSGDAAEGDAESEGDYANADVLF